MAFEDRVRETWPEQADQILGLIRGSIDPDTFQSVETLVQLCYCPPDKHERIACALNEVLNMHGVEACFAEGEFRSATFEYLNAGDTYASTLTYRRGHGWRVSTMGDEIERLKSKGVQFS
jgi:hypothetical protein